MWEKLSTKLKSILEANTLLQKVYNYEKQKPDGIPFATLTPSSNESDYDTTTENQRVYAFTLRLYNERSKPIKPEDAETTMRELVDSVMDDLDKNHRLSGLEKETGYTFLLMESAPSLWGYIEEPAQYRVAEIIVRCRFSIDINLIS